jgi:hypothetical protein
MVPDLSHGVKSSFQKTVCTVPSHMGEYPGCPVQNIKTVATPDLMTFPGAPEATVHLGTHRQGLHQLRQSGHIYIATRLSVIRAFTSEKTTAHKDPLHMISRTNKKNPGTLIGTGPPGIYYSILKA